MSGCRFYGYHPVAGSRMLIAQGGNQCAILSRSKSGYVPCQMEISGQGWDEERCPYTLALDMAQWDKRANFALPDPPAAADQRPDDVIDISGGAGNIPAQFRQVARLANVAGLAGFRLSDIAYGVDMVQILNAPFDLTADNIPVAVRISYLGKQS